MKSLLTPARITLATLMACVFLLSLKQVGDVDALMHLSIGKLIVSTLSIPAQEPFVYPAFGKEFLYTSWLYAAWQYVVYDLLGEHFLSVINATVLALLALVLWQDSSRLSGRNSLVRAAVVLGMFFLAESRLVLRPELYAYLCFALTSWLLGRMVFGEDRRSGWWLPLIALVWANLHSSVPLLLLLFGGFLVFQGVQVFRSRMSGDAESFSREVKLMARLGFLLGLSLLATLVNPNGIDQLLYGKEVVGGDWYKQEIAELQPPSGMMLYVMYGLFVAGAVASVLTLRLRSLPYLLISAGLLYVGLGAVRFYYLFLLLQAPILARAVSLLIPDGSFLRKHSVILPFSLLLIVFSFAKAAGLAPFEKPSLFVYDRLGTGFNLQIDHGGAVDFLRENGVSGRVFNRFEDGQSIIWEGWPDFTVFIDGRGNLTEAQLEQFSGAFRRPILMDALQQQYGFEVIIMHRDLSLEFNPHGVSGEFKDENWALVYFNQNSYVFLRRKGPYRPVIAVHEYRYVRPNVGFSGYADLVENVAIYRPLLIAELERALSHGESVSDRFLLGYAYYADGQFERALASLKQVEDDSLFAPLYLAKTLISLDRIDEAVSVLRDRWQDASNPDFAVTYAEALALTGRGNEAVQILERLLSDNPRIVPPDRLRTIYQAAGQPERVAEILSRRPAGPGQDSDNPNASRMALLQQEALNLMQAGNYERALPKLEEILAMDAENVMALTNLGYCYYHQANFSEAQGYFDKALRLWDDNDAAHYGLGLVYLALGSPNEALQHFERYTELRPTGHYSRLARKHIDELRKGMRP